MSKKLITLFIVGTIALLIGIIVIDGVKTKKQTVSINDILSSNNPVLFYETTCPNCKIVEQFIAEYKIEEKLPITKIEASSLDNSKKLIAVANKCGIPTQSLGVPLMYSEGRCFEGKIEVINYLSEKTGVQVQESTPSATPTQ